MSEVNTDTKTYTQASKRLPIEKTKSEGGSLLD